MLQGRSTSTTYFSDHPVEFLVRSVTVSKARSFKIILFFTCLKEIIGRNLVKFNLIMIIIIIIMRNELFSICSLI